MNLPNLKTKIGKSLLELGTFYFTCEYTGHLVKVKSKYFALFCRSFVHWAKKHSIPLAIHYHYKINFVFQTEKRFCQSRLWIWHICPKIISNVQNIFVILFWCDLENDSDLKMTLTFKYTSWNNRFSCFGTNIWLRYSVKMHLYEQQFCSSSGLKITVRTNIQDKTLAPTDIEATDNLTYQHMLLIVLLRYTDI